MAKVGMFFGGAAFLDGVFLLLIGLGTGGIHLGIIFFALVLLIPGMAISAASTGCLSKKPQQSWAAYAFEITRMSALCGFYAFAVIINVFLWFLDFLTPGNIPRVKTNILGSPVQEEFLGIGSDYVEIGGERHDIIKRDDKTIETRDHVVEKDVMGNWHARRKNLLD